METDDDLLRRIRDEPFSRVLPLQKAELLKRLMARGMSQSDVARKFGISVAYAGDLKRLANAPEQIKKAIAEDTISATLAIKLLKEEGAEKAVEIILEALKLIETDKDQADAGAASQAGGA